MPSNRRAAHQFYFALEFGPHDADTSLAGRRQRIELVAAKTHGFGSYGERLQHSRARAAVRQSDPCRIADLRQLVQ